MTLLFTFLGSLIGISGMLMWKIKKIRIGAISVSENIEQEPEHKYVSEFFENTKYLGKRILHEIVIGILKAWVYVSYVVRKYWNIFSDFVVKKFEHKKGENSTPSGFLKTVGEYKRRVHHFKKRLEEKEKDNSAPENQE